MHDGTARPQFVSRQRAPHAVVQAARQTWMDCTALRTVDETFALEEGAEFVAVGQLGCSVLKMMQFRGALGRDLPRAAARASILAMLNPPNFTPSPQSRPRSFFSALVTGFSVEHSLGFVKHRPV